MADLVGGAETTTGAMIGVGETMIVVGETTIGAVETMIGAVETSTEEEGRRHSVVRPL